MSSSAGIQNLLVNVFRPVYTYDTNTGVFTPTLQLANVAYSGTTISVSNAAIGDGNQNVYVGSNAGNSYLDIRACDDNTTLGFGAGGLISNVSNSVYLGYNAGYQASNASNVIAIGSNTGGNGINNIFLGNGTGSTGSNNILIGHSIAGVASNNLLRIGSTLYGNLASRWVGIGTDTSTSGTNFDVSGNARISGTLSAGTFDVSSGGISSSNLVVSGYLRNALTPTQFDISGGNISNSGILTTNTVRTTNGTVAAPSYSFVSDPSLGIYRVGANQLGFASAGVQRMTISNSNVGIGTSAPTSVLDVRDVSGTIRVSDTLNRQPTIEMNRNSGAAFGANSIADWKIQITASGANYQLVRGSTGGTITPFHIDGATGNAGINTTTPGYVLDVSGTIQGSNLLVPGYLRNALTPTTFDISGGNISNSATLITSNIRAGAPGNTAVTAIQEFGKGGDSIVAGTPAIAFQYRDGAGGYRHFIRTRHDSGGATSGNAIDFFTNTNASPTGSTAPFTGNTLAMAVTSVGVGIGTPTPVTVLDVSGRALIVADGSSSLTGYGVGIDTLVLQHRGSYDTSAISLGKSASLLFANGTANFPQARIVSEMTTASPSPYTANLIFQTNGVGTSLAERMRIHSNGFVGIAQPVPSTTLDVSGSFEVASGTALFDVLPSGGYAHTSMNGYFNVFRAGTTNKAPSNVLVSLSPESGAPHYFLSTNVGIGTTTPSNTLDVSGTTTTGGLISTYVRNALTPTTFDISGGNISNSAVHTTGGLVSTYVRNALTPTTYDISGGNISNSGTIFSRGNHTVSNTSNFLGYLMSNDVGSNWQVGIYNQAGGGNGAQYGGALLFASNGAGKAFIDSNGNLGVGVFPSYKVDANAAANTASVNMSTWPRMAIANNQVVRGYQTTLVTNSLNWGTSTNAIDTNLATWDNSNATFGSSLIVKKSGIWSISYVINATAIGQYSWVDASTNNVAASTYPPATSTVIAFGQGSGTSSSVSWTGYLPSNANVYYKFRFSGTPSAMNTYLTIAFLHETPAMAGNYPFP
jgi:hypothetical protein